MTVLTPEQVWTARELMALGLGLDRVAELLQVSEFVVREALRGDPEEVEVEAASEPLTTVDGGVSGGWPPPADGLTVWREVPVLARDGDRGRRLVKVRSVRLWGRPVLVDAAGDVYCPSCVAMVPAVELGRPDNGHPVGLPAGRGPFAVSPEEMAATAHLGGPRRVGFRDLMREPW